MLGLISESDVVDSISAQGKTLSAEFLSGCLYVGTYIKYLQMHLKKKVWKYSISSLVPVVQACLS